MKLYAVYDLTTGEILQTHQEVDESGLSKELSEAEVLSMLPPEVDRQKVAVATLDRAPMSRASFRIDLKTGALV